MPLVANLSYTVYCRISERRHSANSDITQFLLNPKTKEILFNGFCYLYNALSIKCIIRYMKLKIFPLYMCFRVFYSLYHFLSNFIKEFIFKESYYAKNGPKKNSK